ncbi:hypothetical protein JOC78_001360 [Bacillus ectoiniformans]|nr:hypothetical protein [Bacillus ectoiniformans]
MVTLGGSNVPLPDNKQLNSVTVNPANDVFTVQQSGTYDLEYKVYLTTELFVSSKILLNGSLLPNSEFNPAAVPANYLTKKVTVNLAAGDSISLQLYGLLGVVTLVGNDVSKATMLSITKK